MSLRWITSHRGQRVDSGILAGNGWRIGLYTAALGVAWLARDPTTGLTTAGLFSFIPAFWRSGRDETVENAMTDAESTDAAAETEPTATETDTETDPTVEPTADTSLTVEEQPPGVTPDGGEVVPNPDNDSESVDEWKAFCEQLTDAMAESANGDLTVRVDPDDAPAEATETAEMFNELVGEFSETVQTVDDFSDQVTGATNRVTGRGRRGQIRQQGYERRDQRDR